MTLRVFVYGTLKSGFWNHYLMRKKTQNAMANYHVPPNKKVEREVEPRSSLSAYALASHFTEPSAHESLEAVCRRRQLGVSNTKH
jgi:hypothetical protein